MLLNEQDSGRTIKIRIGENITIRLKENPMTGYQWALGSAAGLELVRNQFEAGEGIGAEGIRELQFRGTKFGSYQLLLKHWRTWEGENSIIARFVATINVE